MTASGLFKRGLLVSVMQRAQLILYPLPLRHICVGNASVFASSRINFLE